MDRTRLFNVSVTIFLSFYGIGFALEFMTNNAFFTFAGCVTGLGVAITWLCVITLTVRNKRRN